MLSARKISVIAMAAVMVSAFSNFWLQRRSVPVAYYPDGSTQVLIEAVIKKVRWYPLEPLPHADAPLQPWWSRMKIGAQRIFIRISGRQRYPIPNPPRFIDFLWNMRACQDMTRTQYWLSEDLMSLVQSNMVFFRFGGSNSARTVHAWVKANLDCVRTNGLVTIPFGQQTPSGATTYCAVIMDKQAVRILPARLLQP